MELSFCRWRVVGWESVPLVRQGRRVAGGPEHTVRFTVRSQWWGGVSQRCQVSWQWLFCHLLLFFFLSFLFWKQKPSAFNLLSFFFFNFNFCIGSCEIFVWKYINHISTVKETINKHPWIHHPDQEMKHCQHLRSPPCAGPWSQLYRDIIHCGFLHRSITIFPMVVNKYLGEVSWKLLSRCLLFLMRKPLTEFAPFFT